MRMRRKTKDVQLPSKTSPGHYVGIRSIQRRDVRPGESITLQTGVLIALATGEMAKIRGENVMPTSITPKGYKDLLVMMHNRGDRNIMIHRGQIIASMEIIKVKKKKEAAARKLMTVTSEARFVDGGE